VLRLSGIVVFLYIYRCAWLVLNVIFIILLLEATVPGYLGQLRDEIENYHIMKRAAYGFLGRRLGT
jgi:hypothetical protein